MSIIINVACFIIGVVSGGIVLMIPLIIILFDIPYTLKLMSRNEIRGAPILTNGIVGIVIYSIVFMAIKWAVYSWLADGSMYYWIGVLLGLLICGKRCFPTSATKSNFRTENSRHYK